MNDNENEGGRDAEQARDDVSGDKTKFCGQMKLKGDAFEGYAPDDVVRITGQIVFTSPITAMPKCRFRITGQVVAPEGSERMLVPAIVKMTGQVVYYPEGVRPRILMGKETFDEAFFQAMTERELLINLGKTRFAPDVQAQSVKEKVDSIINLGKILCSHSLRPFIQVICRDNLGKIEAE